MEIIIIGAGIGGLSAALALALAEHDITILESAQQLAEIGAGVQMTPNATKCFWQWGLGPHILSHSALPASFKVRDGADGRVLASVAFDGFEERYGAPYIVIHRADIHQVLHEHAVKAGVKIRLGARVVDYDFEGGSVMLENGEQLGADLVVAVDGINSPAREALLQSQKEDSHSTEGSHLEKVGWAAYRTRVPVASIKANNATKNIVEQHNCNCWVGDMQLAMTYMIKNAEILNVVLSHPDDVDTSTWTQGQYRDEVNRLFVGWDPCLRELIEMAEANIQNWPIEQVKTLPTWSSKTGKFVIMGDAAHAMAFYLSMGVSMAVEDAAAMVECLRLMKESGTTLQQAIKTFERVRKIRAEAVRDASLHAGNVLELPPGPERTARDAALGTDGQVLIGESGPRFFAEDVSYGIADRRIRDWCYGYDVVEAVRTEWRGS